MPLGLYLCYRGESEIKKGDRIRVSTSSSHFNGREGTIEEISPNLISVHIEPTETERANLQISVNDQLVPMVFKPHEIQSTNRFRGTPDPDSSQKL